MADVRILPEIVSNKIAAGEVVERPVSVVKELVENSLDAGATRITVEIEKGGRDLIRVSDNGYGMNRDNALLAIERYGTSKIFTDQELFAINSFGFRGEALPSMASVSKFFLTTREKDSDTGTRIYIKGGKIMDVGDAGAPPGTMIEVKDLYFNTPARRKFLKSVNTEMGHIADQLSGIALGNPGIGFKLLHNRRVVKNFSGSDDLLQRTIEVLGRESAGNLCKVSLQENNYGVSGYISSPSLTRSTSQRIKLFVNKRMISDRGVVAAIFRGYKGRIMKGRFPLCLLFIKIPFDEVDVNVHPAKREVRFSDSKYLFSAVTRAVQEALSAGEKRMPHFDNSVHNRGNRSVVEKRSDQDASVKHSIDQSLFQWGKKEQVFEETSIFDPASVSMQTPASIDASTPEASLIPVSLTALESSSKPAATSEPESSSEPASTTPEAAVIPVSAPPSAPESVPAPSTSETAPPSISESAAISEPAVSALESESAPGPIAASQFASAPLQETGLAKDSAESVQSASCFNIIGQAFSTYIIAESDQGLFLVDQHAAHERIIYERLKKRAASFRPPSQGLVVPETMEFGFREAALLEKIIPDLLLLGIEIEPFGGSTFIIKSVPAIIDDKDIKPLIVEMVEKILESGLNAGDDDQKEEWLDEVFTLMSCHSAIRANQRLNQSEMENLLNDLEKCDNSYHCPHGRPTRIKWSQYEIEKLFKRVV